MIKPVLILSIICLVSFISCKSVTNSNKKLNSGFSKLTIIINDSSRIFINNVTASSHHKNFRLDWYFKKNNQFKYSCDSLPNDEYNILFSSLINRNFKTSLHLTGDTTIFINKFQLPFFKTSDNNNYRITDLQIDDTLCIGYIFWGCFGFNSNKTLIYKQGNKYVTEFIKDTSNDMRTSTIVTIKKYFNPDFSDTLRKFQMACLKGFEKQKKIKKKVEDEMQKAKTSSDSLMVKSMWFTSTSLISVYFTKGSNTFEFNNNGITEMPYYNEFIKAIKTD